MNAEILWTAGFLNERFPAPISPLGWSVLAPTFEQHALRDPLRFMGFPGAETIPATRLYHGHPYVNVQIFQIFYKPFPRLFLPEDAYRYFPGGDTDARCNAPYPRGLGYLRFLVSMLIHFARDPINWSPLNYWHWARYAVEHDRRVNHLHAQLAAPDLTPRAILKIITDADQATRALLKIHRWSLTYADLTFALLSRAVGSEAANNLVADVPNKTMEVDRDLRAIARTVGSGVACPDCGQSRELPNPAGVGVQLQPQQAQSVGSGVELLNPVGRGVELHAQQALQPQQALAAFLAKHGHRSFSLDIAVPTFADDPQQVLNLAACLPARGNEHSPARDIEPGRGLPPRAFFEPARDTPPDRGLATRAFSVRLLLALTRKYVALREDQRYYWQKSLAVTRRAFLMLAERLVRDGVIAAREDLFYATWEEIEKHFAGQNPDLAARIAQRRAEWQEYARQAHYPAFLRGDTPVEPVESAWTREWRGRAVSPGNAQGHARVVRSPGDFNRIRAGDILIAPATDPAWTPIFARLAGLVLERGGVLSHGAVVAREYGLPAVAGIPNITDVLHDDEMIQVDGSVGVVRKI